MKMPRYTAMLPSKALSIRSEVTVILLNSEETHLKRNRQIVLCGAFHMKNLAIILSVFYNFCGPQYGKYITYRVCLVTSSAK